MPSINTKLASLSSSIKKSIKKVANKLSLKKKNKDGKKEKIFVVANESRTLNEIEIEVAQPAVVVAPFDSEKAKTFLMVSTFGLDDDEEEDEDEEEEEEDIFGDVRDFEAEKRVAVVSVVPKSIVAAVSERSKLCLYVQLIKSKPKAKGHPRLRSFKPQPSPLRNFVVVAPASLPPLPITTTTGASTPPPLSPSSSISSIRSSSSSDNDGPSTPPRNARSSIVQKRVAEIEARCGRELVF